MLLFCFFRWWSSLELYTISECLRFIFCFLTVAVQCREWKWKAAIFIQCLCEPDTVDWLNACHIDTPVVSPMCPQRHNGVGSAAPFCVYMPLAANSVTCWLYNVDDFFFCDFIEWNLRPQRNLIGALVVQRCRVFLHHSICFTATLFIRTICCFFCPGWENWVVIPSLLHCMSCQ